MSGTPAFMRSVTRGPLSFAFLVDSCEVEHKSPRVGYLFMTGSRLWLNQGHLFAGLWSSNLRKWQTNAIQKIDGDASVVSDSSAKGK